MRLSVLDLIYVTQSQSTGEALRASRELVEAADRLGFLRYWVAEHHNTTAVASTTPAVELMYLGQDTERIRLGSGGVMLPNHSPLAVAEQFSLLANVYGDRIDLGIGRAPGTDPLTSAAIRGQLTGGQYVDTHGRPIDPVQDFPRHVQEILALLQSDGITYELPQGRDYQLRAAPSVDAPVQVWLLGSSDYSAQLAAALGVPYVFAHHFSGRGTRRALDLYRSEFKPGEFGREPRTFLSVNAVVADTADEAWELAEPQWYTMAMLRSGGGMGPLPTVGDDARTRLTSELRASVQDSVNAWIVGDPHQAKAQLEETAEQFGVDEVMVQPVAGKRPGEPAGSAPARVRTLELLAEAFAG